MIARVLTIWQWIKNSLWALPLLMVVVAFAAAIAALQVRMASASDTAWWLFSGNAKQVPAFLGHLVSAMITMGTLVISITMVVLTLAAQQLGSRLIHSFMADRRTQAAIGVFVATITYLLVVLRSAYGDTDSVANLAVTLGTGLVLFSVVALPVFVHHLARSIIADTVIERVGHALDRGIESMLPQHDAGTAPFRSMADEVSLAHDGTPVRAKASGYVQTIDHASMVALAQRNKAVIALVPRPGQHVIAGAVIARISPEPEEMGDCRDAIAGAIICGSEPTPVQDIEYSIRQLVEIALRALSPGINDPYTAVTVIDRLAASVALIMRAGRPQEIWYDAGGVVRLIAPNSTFAGLIDVSFNQIRQVGAPHPAVLIHLAHALRELIEIAPKQCRDVLWTHLSLTIDAGRRNRYADYDCKALEQHAGLTPNN